MSDSVGKITLDLEVTSDLSKQVSAMSNALGKNLKESVGNVTKTMFDGMDKSMDNSMKSVSNSLNSGLSKMKETISNTLSSAFATAKTIKLPTIQFPKIDMPKPVSNNTTSQSVTRGPPTSTGFNTEAIKAQMDNVSKTLDNTNAKIEQQQAKLAELKESYNTTFNQANKNKLEEQILKTESAINSLISKSDSLGFKLADLDVKFAEAGDGAEEASSKINDLASKTSSFTSKASGSFNIFKKLQDSFKGLGSSAKSCDNNFHGMQNGMEGIARQFLTWMVILPVLTKGLTAMTTGLLDDLKTNTQFANSLAQVKTNLEVAFTPIFYAILPAINAFMSSLATLTTYIASFISAIFGKTYEQSYKATQGLIDAKKAMGDYGDSAKKAAKDAMGLAGIDEINNLSKSSTANSTVPKLTQPSLDTASVDKDMSDLANKIKSIFSKIFDPMKEAWANQGKATIDALKLALDDIWQLIKDIGKSFLDVWTNGTGEKICEDILKLLQTIFGIIGDIASAFKTAWDTGGLGTALVQAIFNALDSVLQLLNTIGTTFRDVWNSGLGVEICTNILEILKNIFTIVGQIATSFKSAWDSGLGKQIVTDILNLLNGCLRIIKDITSSFSKAWETNGDTICNAILLILDDIVGTLSDITNKWANAWEDNGNGDKLTNSLLSTLGKVLATIGDIGKGIRDSIGKAVDEIFPTLIQFATNVSTGLGNITDGFKSIWDNGGQHLFDGILQLIAKVAELILKISGQAFVDFTNVFKDDLAPAIGTVSDILGTICDKISDFIGWINQCQPLVDILTTTFEALATAFLGFKGLSTVWTILQPVLAGIGTFIQTICSEGIVAALGDTIATIIAAIGGWPVLIGAAIILVGVEIYKHWDEIKTKTAEVWDSISDWLDNKWTYITNTVSTTWTNLKDYISTKWDEIKDNTSTKWEDIKTTLSTKWSDITTSSTTTWDNIKLYIGTKCDEINQAAPGIWDTIKATLVGKWTDISTSSQGVWNGVTDFINTIFSANWSTAWNGIQDTFKKVWDSFEAIAKAPINGIIALMNGLITGINTAIDALNNINIDIPDWVPKIGGDSFGFNLNPIDNIPYLATGGIVDSPTLAMVGEAGKEAVMPLENNTGWISDLAGQIATKIGGSSTSSSTSDSSSGDIVLMIDGSVIGKVALNQLRKMQRQGSVTLIPT